MNHFDYTIFDVPLHIKVENEGKHCLKEMWVTLMVVIVK